MAFFLLLRYNKQKVIELIHVQLKMKFNGLVIVSVNIQQKTTRTYFFKTRNVQCKRLPDTDKK
jgi:hypothetical protein